MHTDDKQHDPLVELGYETKDISPKHIFRATVIFFGFALASWAVVYVAFALLGHLDTVKGVNDLKSLKIPGEPNPILQTNITAKTDIRDMRQREKEVLTTSGDSSYAKGFKRIPIEQAIKLAAERKGNIGVYLIDDLPPTPNPAQTAPTGGEH